MDIFKVASRAAAAAITVVTLLSSAASAAGLFDPATATEMREAARPSRAAPIALRQRLVRLNVAELAQIVPAGADQAANRLERARGLNAPVTIDLFPGLSVRAERTDIDAPDVGGFVWSGKGTGRGDAFVTLVINDGEVLGHIQTGGKLYSIELVSGQVYRILEIDQSKIRDDMHLKPPASLLQKKSEAAPAPEGAEAVTRIYVLVAHTAAARLEAGGVNQMQARITLAFQLANTALKNSGVLFRLYRVGDINEIPKYNEANLYGGLNTSNNYTAVLCDLTGGFTNCFGSGNNLGARFAALRTKRDAVNADLVVLMRKAGAACGIAWVPALNGTVTNANSNRGFSVTTASSNYGCIEGNTFAHEIGHNMGLNHDRYTYQNVDLNGVPPSGQFNFGYINKNAKFFTIMAYGSSCQTLAGSPCTRIPYFSTPLKTYNTKPVGVATGAAAADAARRLNLNRGVISGYQ
jgi:hypothetical protein